MDTRRGYIHRMMRTLTTLLLLVCFAWSQAAAADCRQPSGPGGQADVQESAHPHHHSGHPAPAPAGDDDARHPQAPAHHASTGCGVLVSCGAAASPPAIVPPTAAFADAGHGIGADRGAYASPTLSTDPPPPRIALRS
jgi:hypothetical protein